MSDQGKRLMVFNSINVFRYPGKKIVKKKWGIILQVTKFFTILCRLFFFQQCMICYILQRSLVNANTSAFGFLCQFLCLELLQNNKNFSFCWLRGKLFQNCCIVIKTSTCSGCFVLFLECLRLSALFVLVSWHSQICSESLWKAPNSFLQCY